MNVPQKKKVNNEQRYTSPSVPGVVGSAGIGDGALDLGADAGIQGARAGAAVGGTRRTRAAAMGDDAGTGAGPGPPEEGAGTGAATGPLEGACTGGTAIIGARAGAFDGRMGVRMGALDDGAVVGGTARAGVGSTGGTADGDVGAGTGGFDGAVAGAAVLSWKEDLAML